MNGPPHGADLPPRVALAANEVAAWWMPCAPLPPGAIGRWLAVLSEEERARADRFRFAADREIYIAAHALTRALLAAVGDLPAPAWRFVEGARGKPEIDSVLGRSRLRFSLSHTRGLVACAAGYDDLGIDAESSDRATDELELAGRFFAADEVRLLRAIPREQRRNAFLRIWTLKEAYIKVTGLGLACPLDGFAFGSDPISIAFHADMSDDPAQWQFMQWQPTARHLIALAVRRTAGPFELCQRDVDPNELLTPSLIGERCQAGLTDGKT
jgi:4'-phosphopantetheinyl transferase